MSNCSKHKKDVAGISDMKVLAEMIGDLHYEILSELLEKLCDKICLDAAKDAAYGRKELAQVLDEAARNIMYAGIEIEQAWKISKPFMEQEQL